MGETEPSHSSMWSNNQANRGIDDNLEALQQSREYCDGTQACRECFAWSPTGDACMSVNGLKQGMTQLIHDWRRNGWKNSKKVNVANATLPRESDAAVTRQARVVFTWEKTHNGDLLNECATNRTRFASRSRARKIWTRVFDR
jgi:hypothetical protein